MSTLGQTPEISGALLRIDRVEQLTGLSRTTIDRLEKSGRFPRRWRIAARAVAWTTREIQEWRANQRPVEITPLKVHE
jgi:predicted DNA-binding transcriptional regulator AlpA